MCSLTHVTVMPMLNMLRNVNVSNLKKLTLNCTDIMLSFFNEIKKTKQLKLNRHSS